MTTPRTVIASSFVPETEATASYYPQMATDPASARFQAVYWRCLCVLFTTARRNAPDADLVLFTPASAAPQLGGIDFARLLAALDVELVQVPFDHGPPPGFTTAFRSCLYLFDIVEHLAASMDDDDVVLLVDNDCVCARPLQQMTNALRTAGILAYHIPYPPDLELNGLTLRQQMEIYRDMGFDVDEPPEHVGGELFAATGSETRRVHALLEEAWRATLQRFERGEPRFNTEEQHLTFALNRLGVRPGSANAFIDRIWHERPAEPERAEATLELAVWHTPAEKRLGFRSLFAESLDRGSRLWQLPVGDHLARHLGRHLGIPYRSRRKRLADAIAARTPRLGPLDDRVAESVQLLAAR